MNDRIGADACDGVELAVQSCHNHNVIWKKEEKDKVQSVVGCLQLYSEKSQTSLSAAPYAFHPLHITLLYFSKEMRRKQIVFGSSVVSYLPIRLSERDEAWIQKKWRLCKIANFHRCITC